MYPRNFGTTTVEFAIVILVALIAVIGIVEVGRMVFVANTLTEATRRGARMAVVCPVGDPRPAQVAVFADTNGASPIVYGLSTDNIQTEYLDMNGDAIAGAAGSPDDIRYVRVSIVGFSMSLFVPTVATTVQMSGHPATLPRESLGINRAGVTTPC
jgi:Flp pilus assembly protein TadG